MSTHCTSPYIEHADTTQRGEKRYAIQNLQPMQVELLREALREKRSRLTLVLNEGANTMYQKQLLQEMANELDHLIMNLYRTS